MPSAALDDFNTYITARKADADTYITNKKTQVDALNTARKAEVTASSLNNAAKTQMRALLDAYTVDIKGLFDDTGTAVKSQLLDVFVAKGENFLYRVLIEETLHLRKHILAARNGTNEDLCDQLDAVATSLETEDESIVIAYAKALDP